MWEKQGLEGADENPEEPEAGGQTHPATAVGAGLSSPSFRGSLQFPRLPVSLSCRNCLPHSTDYSASPQPVGRAVL